MSDRLSGLVIILLLLLPFAAHGQTLEPGSLNNRTLTPGAVLTTNKAKICRQYTSTIRDVSQKMKNQVFARYGVTNRTGWCAAGGCEIDHLISLELGGSNAIGNLWPQPYVGTWNAHFKDALEARLHKLICDGALTPMQAQYMISHNWIIAYKRFVK